MSPLKVLGVHGVGDNHTNLAWQDQWREAITRSIQKWNDGREVLVEFVMYDDLFEAAPLNAEDVAEALWKLGLGGLQSGITDLFGRSRGFGDITAVIRWTAGMVVQWAEDEKLRAQTRARVMSRLKDVDPDIICAHSLGSLVCYDTFTQKENKSQLAERTYVSFGSQLGNPFIRGQFGGRIVEPPIKSWYHLFNKHDHVFTAPLRLNDSGFEQVKANFDSPGMLNHDATEYLSHPNVVDSLWRDVSGAPLNRALERTTRVFARATRQPKRRALLVGINDYPNPANRLEGCVNDVFLVSEILQQCGFKAEDIRVVLNERATAAGLQERLQWLLDGADDEQERVFFYSGHGAQIPGYGAGEKVDRDDECLVPYDFDWSREKAFTDDQFYELYSQLPYDARFVTIFDCCHAGGMTRDGARVRGLSPPDDIRHRALWWNAGRQMWQPRHLPPLNPDLKRHKGYAGRSGSVRKLGRSAPLRILRDRAYDRACKARGHRGPFLPIIYQACQEGELAQEYRHGASSYGAFTYTLASVLRGNSAARRRRITFEQVLHETIRSLHSLGYTQTPALVGPRTILKQPIPWKTGKRK